MAIVNNGTINAVKSYQIPLGYTKPTVTKVLDYQYSRTITLSVLKATVENADPKITMANIIANATIGITKQVTDILAADYLATATVTAYTVLRDITTNLENKGGADEIFLANPTSYQCLVNIYVKAV